MMKLIKWPFAVAALLVAGLASGQTVSLTASPTTGISPLSVTLNWSATGFGSGATCTASGAWSGSRALSGTATVTLTGGSYTYNLSCANTTGSATVSWTPPTTNTDNTPISATAPGALAGYEIFRATTSAGVATATPVAINDRAVTTYTFDTLPVGTHFYRIRALNTEGVRSDLSAEVSGVVVAPSATANTSVVVNVKPNPPVPTVVARTVYEAVPDRWDGVRLGRVLGTAEIGTACQGEAIYQTWNATYYRVETYSGKNPRPNAVAVAACEYT